MYEIFRDGEAFNAEKNNNLRRKIPTKGECILKSKSNNVLKRKKVFADLSNIMKSIDKGEPSIQQEGYRLPNQSDCDKNTSRHLENIEAPSSSSGKNELLSANMADKTRELLIPSCDNPDRVLHKVSFYSQNFGLNEMNTVILDENHRIEEDVFFGTQDSLSEDEKELSSRDSPETIFGYCSDEGCSDEACDRWFEQPLWKTSEELAHIVGFHEGYKNETFEDMEFTSIFCEIPCAGKPFLDVPDILFGSENEDDLPTPIPIPDLEW